MNLNGGIAGRSLERNLTGLNEMGLIGGRLTAPPLPHHRAYGSRTAAVRSG
jgi:hypothetical protein